MPDNENSKARLKCPLVSAVPSQWESGPTWTNCIQESCAWWDVLYKHCAILGINHWLGGIAERSTLIMSEDDKSINIRVLK